MSIPLIAVTPGDPNGIGPEVALKALISGDAPSEARFVLIGPAEVWRFHAQHLGLDIEIEEVSSLEMETRPGGLTTVGLHPSVEVPPVNLGTIAPDAGALAMEAVAHAIDLAMTGKVAGIVTAPISKEAIAAAGYRVPGHTEFLAARSRTPEVAMILAEAPPDLSGPALRVALLTTHLPVRDVAAAVTEAAILSKLVLLDAAVRRDLGIAAPRIAVLGLNPHAGDGGAIGHEDEQIVRPGIERARQQGVDAQGPFPADGFFGRRAWENFDVVLAMYHDQGLAPFKALVQGRGVNWTAGLPFVRTSPDHGTGFDIAGAGTADPSSMIAALRFAAYLARYRNAT